MILGIRGEVFNKGGWSSMEKRFYIKLVTILFGDNSLSKQRLLL